MWLKRDLRMRDHAPLCAAAERGPILVAYVYEPDQLDAPTHDASHLNFIRESLAELERQLVARGARLTLLRGLLPDAFERLHARVGFEAIWSHEETGHARSYARDERVKTWCRGRGIAWHEIPQHGVVRRLGSRDGWAARWTRTMRRPLLPEPERLEDALGAPDVEHVGLLGPADLGLTPSGRTEVQRGGETQAQETLDSFLAGRSVSYRTDMSSPLSAWNGCSRLSPHLAYGTISIREVAQRSAARREELKEMRARGEDLPATWLSSLASFEKRLRWHCHFIQKLEDEPALEFRNMARACDGLREDEWSEERFEAWKQGRTGYPMVDACMRALEATGWINFRMRAMLVSFASYHLWLHWPRVAEHLARLFLDFEAGIHFSQVQMQSGTTGINAVRIYSPVKQVIDQDPRGEFIRRWVPELAPVPVAYLPEPYKMPLDEAARLGCRIGRDYPRPIVENTKAMREARERLSALRRGGEARQESRAVYEKHGSRRRPPPRRRARS